MYLVFFPKLSFEMLKYLKTEVDSKVEHIIEPTPSSPVVTVKAAIITSFKPPRVRSHCYNYVLLRSCKDRHFFKAIPKINFPSEQK